MLKPELHSCAKISVSGKRDSGDSAGRPTSTYGDDNRRVEEWAEVVAQRPEDEVGAEAAEVPAEMAGRERRRR